MLREEKVGVLEEAGKASGKRQNLPSSVESEENVGRFDEQKEYERDRSTASPYSLRLTRNVVQEEIRVDPRTGGGTEKISLPLHAPPLPGRTRTVELGVHAIFRACSVLAFAGNVTSTSLRAAFVRRSIEIHRPHALHASLVSFRPVALSSRVGSGAPGCFSPHPLARFALASTGICFVGRCPRLFPR